MYIMYMCMYIMYMYIICIYHVHVHIDTGKRDSVHSTVEPQEKYYCAYRNVYSCYTTEAISVTPSRVVGLRTFEEARSATIKDRTFQTTPPPHSVSGLESLCCGATGS